MAVNALDLAISLTIKRYRENHKIKMPDLAEAIGISEAVFRNKANPNSDHEFKASELDRLARLTGDGTIGQVLTNAANVDQSEAESIPSILIDAGASSGEVLKVVRDALADGRVTHSELQMSISAISESIENFEKIERALIKMSEQK